MTTIVVGNIPPPVDGAGMVTARAVGLMREHGLEPELFDCFDAKGRIAAELISYGRAALRILRRDVDTAYIQGVQGERMLFVLLLLVAAKLSGTSVIHHHHAFKFIDSPSLLWRLICSTRFDVTHVVLSEGMGKSLESIYGNSKWRSVSNAAFVRDEFLVESERVESDDPVVLFAGVAGIGKGEDVLLDAVRQVREKTGLPVKLVLAGRGHHSDEEFVENVGVLSSAELASHMRQASVLALPSSYVAEAAPMVLYEAAACGLPSISSDRGCIPEMSAELGGAIEIVDPSVSVLAESLERHFCQVHSDGLATRFVRVREIARHSFAGLLASPPDSGELDGVTISQLIGAPYRAEVFGKAADAGCRFVWGDTHFQRHITSAQKMPRVNPKLARNRFLASRHLVWQSGSLAAMLTARVLIIEANPRWLNTYVAVAVRKLLGRPTVFWGHFGHHGDAGRVRSLIRRTYRRMPDKWMSYTETEAILFRQHGIVAEAAPNPLPPCTDRDFCVDGEGQDLLFLGRIDESKGLDKLLGALAQGPSEARLHVVGDGPLQSSMIKLATELGVETRVDFHGFLPCGEELHSIMKRCWALVIPTYAGLNLPQAMAHGLTALVNDACSHSPEIEAAELFPGLVVEHDGTASGLSVALGRKPGSYSQSEYCSAISGRYSTVSWLLGLRNSAMTDLYD